MIKGAIFDVDGTLIDSMGMWNTFGSDIVRRFGKIPEDGLDCKIRYFSLKETAEYICGKYLGVPPEEGEKIIFDETLDFYKNRVLPKPGACELCRKLYERGVKMYIATATYKPLVTAALVNRGMYGFFDGIVTCEEVGTGKSHPKVFLEASSRLGIDISDTWVFEDAYHAVATAKKAGYRVLCVYDAAENDHIAELKKLSDIYVDDFTDFNYEKLF